MRIEGGVNVLLLGGVVGAVLLSGVWKPGISFEILGVELELQNVVRDVLAARDRLCVAGARRRSGPRRPTPSRWGPILEVAKLFAGIFLTIIPAIAILRAGARRCVGGVVRAVTDAGRPADHAMYFWLTGVLSCFLDNAPTYLVFFNLAGGDPRTLMGDVPLDADRDLGRRGVHGRQHLYRQRAQLHGEGHRRGARRPMPSFFGYMAWSGLILVPLSS